MQQKLFLKVVVPEIVQLTPGWYPCVGVKEIAVVGTSYLHGHDTLVICQLLSLYVSADL